MLQAHRDELEEASMAKAEAEAHAHFAHEAGLLPPSLWETAGWCALGLALMLWALPKLANQQ